MKINFFDRENVIKSFSKLYNIEESTLVALSEIANWHNEPTAYFMSLCPIKLDEVDISDVELHCKHITTQLDGCESLCKIYNKNVGLRQYKNVGKPTFLFCI